MYKRIILMILVIGFLSCNPASAVNLVVNGDFETGDSSGWTFVSGGTTSHITVDGLYNNSSSYGIRLYSYSLYDSSAYFYQDIDLTSVDDLSYDIQVVTMYINQEYNEEEHEWYSDGSWFYTYLGSTVVQGELPVNPWTHININVSSYSGVHRLKFYVAGIVELDYHNEDVYIDNIVADDGTEPTNYIVWSTWPEDSWAVGNYSMIVVGLPRPPDPVDFYIKTPSTDYIKKPLTKSPLVKTWNYEESQWYYQYFHTVYHSQYGDYSCKIVNSSADFIEYSNITVPYSSPGVPIPPVVTIPTPGPIETPPEWNVTIPEQYENVSWIFDYTNFWDELGITLNDTLYSTVGLIFIPMESINESIYTVYTHVDTAADMVSGSEHTNVIVQVAWNVIPDSIKTVFIGAAAIGLCIFILHRRT